jgi:PilZ domain
VERRSEPRFEAQRSLALTVLAEGGESLPALAVEISGSGMRLLVNRPVPVGAAVKVEPDDSMMLGEVCYCEPDSAGGYYVGVKLLQVLHGLGELARLNRRLLGEETRSAPGVQPATVAIGVRVRR